MKTLSRGITVPLIVSLLLPPLVAGQSSAPALGNWANLGSITPGQNLMVKTKDGKTIHGKFLGYTDSSLELSETNGAKTIRSADVASVYALRRRSVARLTLAGAGIGAGAGAAIGAGLGNSRDMFGKSLPAAIGAAIGLIGGTVAGLIVGKTWTKKVLILEVR